MKGTHRRAQRRARRAVRAGGAALALALLAGCGGDPEPIEVRKMEDSVVYRCDGDRGFEALFRAGQPAVTLLIEGQTLVLPQVPAASGIAYSDGSLTYRAKGREAFTEGWPSGDYEGCVQQE